MVTVQQRVGVMNKLFSVVVVIALLVACAAGYWYVNPQHMPSIFRDPAPGFQVPTPRSPVSNFRPPQF